jgi:hypothetical protein
MGWTISTGGKGGKDIDQQRIEDVIRMDGAREGKRVRSGKEEEMPLEGFG